MKYFWLGDQNQVVAIIITPSRTGMKSIATEGGSITSHPTKEVVSKENLYKNRYRLRSILHGTISDASREHDGSTFILLRLNTGRMMEE